MSVLLKLKSSDGANLLIALYQTAQTQQMTQLYKDDEITFQRTSSKSSSNYLLCSTVGSIWY